MKAISLWQPWATLIAIGAKRIETRSWSTSYRGELAIHAAKKWDKELNAVCDDVADIRNALLASGAAAVLSAGRSRWNLPLGVIVCTCRLVDCRYISASGMGTSRRYSRLPDSPERSFGDYTPGRFAWILEDIKPLVTPIPWRGAQGPFDVPDDAIRAAMDASQTLSPVGDAGGLFT